MRTKPPYPPDYDPNALPLVEACSAGDLPKVRMLVSKGAPINAIGSADTGLYPLHAAAERGDPRIVSHLLEHGARVDARTASRFERQSETPLIIAAYKGQCEVAEVLVQAGADVDAETLTHCTPIAGAVAAGNRRMFDLLIRKGATLRESHLRGAVKSGNLPLVCEILRRGMRLGALGGLLHEAIASHGARCLIAQPKRNQLGMIEYLVKNGVDADQVSGPFGETPLVKAACEGKWDVLALLLELGANPNRPSTHGAWALNYAARRGGVAAAERLVRAGAKLDTVDFEGLTPIEWALQDKNERMFLLLVENGARVPKALLPKCVRQFGKEILAGARSR